MDERVTPRAKAEAGSHRSPNDFRLKPEATGARSPNHVIGGIKRAAATTCLVFGLFLIVAGGAGYIAASLDPVHTTGDQLALIAVGIAFTTAGRLIPR